MMTVQHSSLHGVSYDADVGLQGSSCFPACLRHSCLLIAVSGIGDAAKVVLEHAK